MKHKKFNLDELKVKSFVTDMKTQKSETVKGGTSDTGMSAMHMCSHGVCMRY